MNFLLNFNFLLANGDNDGVSPWMWAVMGVLVLAILVFPMITRRKRGKQVNDLRTTLRIGDEVMTAGGIVGTIVEIIENSPTDKDFIIETGQSENKSLLRFDLRALYENRTRIKELKEEAAKQAELARIAREEKKSGNNKIK
ncbi:MAG: preprotein translocase subunit YajC [Firmicutes bacterium]|nr:preprotein translocase subunit YajC [Bacillota bacterium]